jgi:predicted acyl esterase
MYTKILKPEIMSTLLPEGFPADKLSKPQYKVVVDRDVFVTMRDGVRVACDIFRPDAPGQFPAIYAASGYQKDLEYLPQWPVFHFRETNDIEWFVSRGYAYVHQDVRGTGKSVEGEFQLFSQEEQNDHYDMVEWIAEQPWCAGKIGMIGESYLAWVQWFTAAMQPPHLACIAPFDAGADMYRDVAFHGGIMALGFPANWWTAEIRANYRLGRYGPADNVGLWDLPWNVMHHPACDDFWKVRNPDFAKIKVPVYSIGILHKVGIHLRGNIRGYETVTTPKKLLLCHGDFEGDEMAIFNSREIQLLLLRWYDHWLKGNDTGLMEEDPVTVFVRNREIYRPEKGWPLPQTQYKNLYLAAGPSGGVASLNDGLLTWEPPTAAYEPAPPAPAPGAPGSGPAGTMGRPRSAWAPEDVAAAGETRATVTPSSTSYDYPDPDWSHFSGLGTAVMEDGVPNPVRKILTFATEPLEEDLEVIGSIVLNLWASSDQTDTDFFVRLTDQLPDAAQVPGMPPRALMLTRGWLRASHAATKDEAKSLPYRPYYRHDTPELLEPGKLYKFEIEVWATSCFFPKGHRVRVDLACYDSNAFDFGGHYYGLKMGRDTVYHDKDHPSHIVLPVIPTA